MRICVFICRCNGNISDTIDVNLLSLKAESVIDVKNIFTESILCSKTGQDSIKKAIQNQNFDRIVIVACSPHLYEDVFRKVLFESGLNPYLLEIVNIREQCSFVHKNKKIATEKAIDLMLGGILRAKALHPILPNAYNICKHALVIGGGIAGITCALQIANSGFPVTIIDRKPSIGGHMAQLYKVFPTLDCSPCILSPITAEVAKHPYINVVEMSELEKVSGSVGSFYVEILQSPRGVDASLCIRCGKCAEVCPINVQSEFDEKMYNRKAIYLPFPDAFPSSYVLDFKNCNRCGLCLSICPTNAISFTGNQKKIKIEVGAIVLATGYDLLDLSAFENVGYRNPHVITAMQMERLLANELGTGKTLKHTDGKRVRRIAYLLCSGSRDVHHGVPYCSKICCSYTLKQAILLKRALPYTNIWIYYTEMRMAGRGFEELLNEARNRGIIFTRGKPGEIVFNKEDDNLQIITEDRDSGLLLLNQVDLIVLTPPLVPARGTDKLAEKLKISQREDKFIAEKHSKINPMMTTRAGVFVAGTTIEPKDIRDSITDAKAAAAEVINLFKNDQVVYELIKPVFEEKNCISCGECVVACPQKALTLENGKITTDYVTCDSCGICIATCKSSALDMAHYTREQIEQQIRGILSSPDESIRIIAFCEDSVAYRAADALGTARLNYQESIRIIRVPSSILVNSRNMLLTLLLGADAVMICDREGTPEINIIENNIKKVQQLLMECKVDASRVVFKTTSLSDFQTFRMFIDNYASNVRALGRISPETKLEIISKADLFL